MFVLSNRNCCGRESTSAGSYCRLERRRQMRTVFMTFALLTVLVSLWVVPANAKVTEIRYWTFLEPTSDDVRSVAQTRQIKRFEELNPDIRVKVEIVHWSKQVDMYIQAAAAGK